MAITGSTLNKLAYYEYNINGETFVKNWMKVDKREEADSLAKHFWSKFHGYDHSIIKLAGNMEPINQRILAKVINMGYK